MKTQVTKNRAKRLGSFALIHPYAAGIDVGDKEIVVAVSPDLCEHNVRTFGTFTCDLVQIESFLKDCGITSVALESTGVYWVQLFLHLTEAGFKMILANSKHIKNVSGRKDDEIDAMWIQRLHSCGLINSSFQPDNQTRALRDLTRHRRSLIGNRSQTINRMIKALELMNIKVSTVISDVEGTTGTKIIESILAGERDAVKLASLADPRIKASQEELTKSLEGIWSSQQLFILKQQYEAYQFYSTQIKQTDLQLEDHLKQILACCDDSPPSRIDLKQERKRSTAKNRIPFNATAYLKAILKTDITKIPGINELSALEFMSEVGPDMGPWKTENHFTSWLGIVPNTKKSGGKIISSKIIRKKHRGGQILRMAASTLYHSNTPLGDFFRRKQAKGGPSKAILATATKLAINIYMMIKRQAPYQPDKMIQNQIKWKEAKLRHLQAQISRLNEAA